MLSAGTLVGVVDGAAGTVAVEAMLVDWERLAW